VSERVSWEVCPRCGRLAAVGWVAVPGGDGAPCGSRPVEFDCPTGCQVGLDVLAQVYRLLRRTPVAPAPDPVHES
jgi:hypothetical protein